MEESDLIKKVQSGDVHAFSDLVDTHKSLVFSLAYRMVGVLEDAEEVAQDSFVKAFKSINQFKGESKFSTWLYRITYFTSVNHLRQHKMLSAPIDMSHFSSDDLSALDKLNDLDQKKYISIALAKLKPLERTLITLYYLDEFSNKEIHEITGLGHSHIKVTLMRSRKKLYGIMNQLLKDELKHITHE